MKKRLCTLLALLLTPPTLAQKPRFRIEPMDEARNQWVERTLAAMTLEEKVGQLIVPGFRAGFFGKDSSQFQQIERNIRQFHVGRYHLFPEIQQPSATPGSAIRIDGNLSGAALPEPTRIQRLVSDYCNYLQDVRRGERLYLEATLLDGLPVFTAR